MEHCDKASLSFFHRKAYFSPSNLTFFNLFQMQQILFISNFDHNNDGATGFTPQQPNDPNKQGKLTTLLNQ